MKAPHAIDTGVLRLLCGLEASVSDHTYLIEETLEEMVITSMLDLAAGLIRAGQLGVGTPLHWYPEPYK